MCLGLAAPVLADEVTKIEPAGSVLPVSAELRIRLDRDIKVALTGLKDPAERAAVAQEIEAAIDAYVDAMAKVPGERKDISVTTNPNLGRAPVLPPPSRDCVKTGSGAVLPIPRTDGDDVDMAACWEAVPMTVGRKAFSVTTNPAPEIEPWQPGPQDQVPAK